MKGYVSIMRKILLTITIFLLAISVTPAFSENFEIVSDWIDLFYENGRNPWELKITDLTFSKSAFKKFTCQKILYKGSDYRMTCDSNDDAFEGDYRIIFSFGKESNSSLDAIEFIVYHPLLQNHYQRYNNIDNYIESLSEKLRMKSYSGNYTVEYEIEKYVHTIMTPKAINRNAFRFPGSGVTVGQIEDLLIVNISSYEYYCDHFYYEIFDQFGMKNKIFVKPL